MKFAVLALLGLIQANNQDKLFDAIYDDELIQTEVPGPAYEPWQSEEEAGYNTGYFRVIPANFAADSDDIFMRSVISTYAQEGSDCDEAADGSLSNCKPTGKFTLNKSGARALATEVLGTHAGLSGDALSTYLNTYFDKAWGHFDVMQTGSIAAAKAGALCRFLMSDQRTQLGEAAF